MVEMVEILEKLVFVLLLVLVQTMIWVVQCPGETAASLPSSPLILLLQAGSPMQLRVVYGHHGPS